MKLGQFYKLMVEEGIKQDPRKKEHVLKYLKSVKDEYMRLPSAEKEAFDKEKLSNPYSDTRVLFGSPDTEITTIMAGIDAETPELLLADKLRQKGKKIDAVFSHHPQGAARAEFYRVMNVLYDVLKTVGVSGTKIKKMLDDRINEVMRKVLAGNSARPVDAAKLLNIPFMCGHTVADNFVYQFFHRLLKKEKPSKLSDVIDLLYEIPEYKIAMKNNQGPKIILGTPSNKCGKVLIEMTGGTEGPKDIYKDLSKNKVTTLLSMHLSEEHFKKAKKSKMNVVIAGHISSDSLGMNLLFDAITKRNRLNIIPCSGFTRVER